MGRIFLDDKFENVKTFGCVITKYTMVNGREILAVVDSPIGDGSSIFVSVKDIFSSEGEDIIINLNQVVCVDRLIATKVEYENYGKKVENYYWGKCEFTNSWGPNLSRPIEKDKKICG